MIALQLNHSDYLIPVEIDECSERYPATLFWVELPHDELNFFLGEILLEFGCHIPQVVCVDVPLHVCVDFVEDLFDVFARVLLVRLLEDHPEELSEIDVSTFVLVVGSHSLIYVIAFRVVSLVLAHGFE